MIYIFFYNRMGEAQLKAATINNNVFNASQNPFGGQCIVISDDLPF